MIKQIYSSTGQTFKDNVHNKTQISENKCFYISVYSYNDAKNVNICTFYKL